MRIDNKGKMHTLEEDIQEIWHLHGWRVIKESVKGNKWEITALLEKDNFVKLCEEGSKSKGIKEFVKKAKKKFEL
jgi:hypothetical protein